MRSAPIAPPPLPFSVYAPSYPPPGYPPRPPPPPPSSHCGYFDGNYSMLPLPTLLQTTSLYDSGSTYFFQLMCFSAVAYHLGWGLVHKYKPDFGLKVRSKIGRAFGLQFNNFYTN